MDVGLGQFYFDLVMGQFNGGHGADPRDPHDQGGAAANDLHSVLHRQSTGDDSGGDFTE
ncbi:Uncharacterised protein [Mycobacteroides abscessus subsp. massiliense]|nr:Uncharacterised protein [Mycobacteroides abscessus subsp. massiliense]